MNKQKKIKPISYITMLSLVFVISTFEAKAAEEIDSKTEVKAEVAKKTCLTFAQLKPGQKKEYSNCVRHTYNKARCKKKSNLCLK